MLAFFTSPNSESDFVSKGNLSTIENGRKPLFATCWPIRQLKKLPGAIKARWDCEGSPKAQGRARPRQLRGSIMARSSPTSPHEHDRVRFLRSYRLKPVSLKRNPSPTLQPTLTALRHAILAQLLPPPHAYMPALPKKMAAYDPQISTKVVLGSGSIVALRR